MRDDGLTEDEGEVMDHLVDAVEAWAYLPRQHPNEDAEFFAHIHRLQDLMATRIARRHHPEGWPTHAADSE